MINVIQDLSIYFLSILCVLSRASLNIIDRKQYHYHQICPIVLGYWNNLFPLLIFEIILFLLNFDNFLTRVNLTFEPFLLASLAQIISYVFGYCFKFINVVHLGFISKSADLTISLGLIFLGFQQGLDILFLGLISSLFLVFYLFKNQNANFFVIFLLILTLTINGLVSFLFNERNYVTNTFTDLINLTEGVLLWRLIFSILILLAKQNLSSLYIFPINSIAYSLFSFRVFLSIFTQGSFIYLISHKFFILVIPILNMTAIAGALLAFIFLGEKLGRSDIFFISMFFLFSSSLFFY